MLLHAAEFTDLELRRRDGFYNVRGRFPYNKPAVLSDGGRTGRPRKEVIASRAFAYRVNDPAEDIHFLLGHSYDKPLASKLTQTLSFEDTAAALNFEAKILPAVADTSHGADALALIETGLAVGISPGFRIPPKRAVAEAETVADEGMRPSEGAYNAIIRTVWQALLYEISLVTRPAYPESEVEARSWDVSELALPHNPMKRWRY